jgi:hypothetical protein
LHQFEIDDGLLEMASPKRCITDKPLAGKGKARAASTALEQRHSKAAFKRLDAAADGRLGKVQRVRGPANAPKLRYNHCIS